MTLVYMYESVERYTEDLPGLCVSKQGEESSFLESWPRGCLYVESSIWSGSMGVCLG